jgi:hypothetical protein
MTMPANVIGPAPGATLGLGCRNQIWEWGIRVYKINRAQTQFHIFAFESGSSVPGPRKYEFGKERL